MKRSPAQYHCHDFDFNCHVESLKASHLLEHLPEIVPLDDDDEVRLRKDIAESSASVEEGEKASWNQFFQHHSTGQIYKPRRYILPEFNHYLSLPHIHCLVEVGCGYGCTMLPILQALVPGCASLRYIATDYSREALTILEANPACQSFSTHIVTAQWDIASSSFPAITLPDPISPDLILCIFTLSAVPPSQHLQTLFHLKQLLTPPRTDERKKYLLFRDYGVYDFSMLEKHVIRHEEFFFRRLDGTICYYFSLEYLQKLAEEAGFEVLELSYATVINHNRKTGEKLHRVFVHAVLAV
eukprot:gene3214-3426_t